MKEEMIVVLDFGGQYNELIARRVRDLHVYSEVWPFNTDINKLKDPSIKGIIFTGGPNSVYAPNAPQIDKSIFEIGKPILGICYGAQLIAYSLGGKVEASLSKEYGPTPVAISSSSILYSSIPTNITVFMSHGDKVTRVPLGFTTTSSTLETMNCSFENPAKAIYAVQFHPEVEHTEHWQDILSNFVHDICKCSKSWKDDSFISETIDSLKSTIKDGKVICALSGGVDSAVTAALLDKAIGSNLYCVFVDHGLLRKNEAKEVIDLFSDKTKFKMNFIPVDASKLFLERLEGITDPEQKRKIIGKSFIDVFASEQKKILGATFLAQGTIYPDRIESGLGLSSKIKSHHNVGGLPKDVSFKIVEPLRDLFKDEVRKIGLALGLLKSLVYRQPFPGPGLAIRIVGEITKEKIEAVQEADFIFRSIMDERGLSAKASQYFAALSNMKSVGVKGDARSYDYAVVIRAVSTDDFMSATPVDIPYKVMTEIANRIVDEVPMVNRVLFDFTSKPPATIELE